MSSEDEDRNEALGQPLKLPNIDFSHLALPKLAAPLIANIEAWQRAMQPLVELGERIKRTMEEATAPLAGKFDRIRREDRMCERLEALGWLPHDTSPFGLVEEDSEDQAALDAAIEAYFSEEWSVIAAKLIAGIEECDIDDEAKASFAEAVAAHGAGFHRCAPRLLFPEIERVSRKEIHGGALDKMASQHQLVEAISRLTPGEMSSSGVSGLRFYRKLTEHLYRHMKDDTAVAVAAGDPVPNRHAAVHGIVIYNSAKSSLNSIFVADYLLRAISTIKQYQDVA